VGGRGRWLGVQGAISWQSSSSVIPGFSRVFLSWSLQVLGPQCGEHEVDLSGPHLGCHRGKNLVAESPNAFWGKVIDRDPGPFTCGHWGWSPWHPGRAHMTQRDPWPLVPPHSDYSITPTSLPAAHPALPVLI